MELLYNSMSLTISGLKPENIPNRWDGLYTVPPLNKTRFWSVAPPLTLNPLEASPTDFTPGSVRIILTTSDSPNTIGTFFILSILTFSTPILLFLSLFVLSAVTTIPDNAKTFSFTTISSIPSP